MELTQVAEQLCGECRTVLTSAHTHTPATGWADMLAVHMDQSSISMQTRQDGRSSCGSTACLVLEAADRVLELLTYVAAVYCLPD